MKLLGVLVIMVIACGGDNDTAMVDATPPPIDAVDPGPCPAELAPISDGSARPASGIPDYIISALSPGNYIEIYNTTDSDIDLAILPYAVYMWCSRPSYTAVTPQMLIPAKSFVALDWPGFPADRNNAGGEAINFANSAFANGANQIDFLCWGTGNASTRKVNAELFSKWSGDCLPSIPDGGSIVRKIGVAGNSAADYDVMTTQFPRTCTPGQ